MSLSLPLSAHVIKNSSHRVAISHAYFPLRLSTFRTRISLSTFHPAPFRRLARKTTPISSPLLASRSAYERFAIRNSPLSSYHNYTPSIKSFSHATAISNKDVPAHCEYTRATLLQAKPINTTMAISEFPRKTRRIGGETLLEGWKWTLLGPQSNNDTVVLRSSLWESLRQCINAAGRLIPEPWCKTVWEIMRVLVLVVAMLGLVSGLYGLDSYLSATLEEKPEICGRCGKGMDPNRRFLTDAPPKGDPRCGRKGMS